MKFLFPGHFFILLVISAFILSPLNVWFNKREYERYPERFSRKERAERDVGLAWKWLNENTGEGRRIAYTGRAEFYPLFGTHLKNDVLYVSVNDKPSIPHYYPDGDYRKEKNFDLWLKNLKREKIDLLFIYQMHDSPDFPIENDWADRSPDYFKLIFVNTKVRIFTLKK